MSVAQVGLEPTASPVTSEKVLVYQLERVAMVDVREMFHESEDKSDF